MIAVLQLCARQRPRYTLLMFQDDALDLPNLRMLTQVADLGSLAAVARSTGMSASAIGKSLTRLEARLGLRFFNRSTRNLTLTDEGAMVVAHARDMLSQADALRERLTGRVKAPSGLLRLSLPLVGEPFFGVVASFARAYPDVELEIDFSDRQVDIVAEGFDVAIRSGQIRDMRVIVKSLGSFQLELVASPAYLEVAGNPRSPAELATHRQVRFRYSHSGKPPAWPVDGSLPEEPTAAVTCNNLEARIAFAIEGLGIALLPSFSIYEHLQSGRLVRVMNNASEEVPVSLLWPSNLNLASRLRAFADHVTPPLRLAMQARYTNT